MKRLLSRLFNRIFPSSLHTAHRKLTRDLGCGVEPLESRIAPAAIATFSKGTLLLQGNPDGVLAIEQTSEVVDGKTIVTTTVTDNSAPLAGTSSFTDVKNIVVKFDPRATDANEVSMKLIRVPGNVEVLAPKEALTAFTLQGLAPLDNLAQIGKSALFKGGKGTESLSISGLEIGGGLVFPAGKGGASIVIDGNVSIGSNVGLIGTEWVTINPGAQIGGNLLITQKEVVTESFILGSGAKIDGNVVIYAGPSSTSINAYAEVGGRFFVNAGQGVNVFNVSLIAKSLQYVGGSSVDSVTCLGSEIKGEVSFILAGGENQIFFNVGPAWLFGDFVVGKNLTVGGGNDNDIVRLETVSGSPYKVSVGGKSVFSLSGGDNGLFWNGASSGAGINIAGANGTDVVWLYGLQAPTAALNVNLGGGNDRLMLTEHFLKASLNGSAGNDEIIAGSVLPAKTSKKGFEIG